MSVAHPLADSSHSRRLAVTGRALLALAGGAAVGTVLALALYLRPVSLSVVLLLGIGLVATLVLTLASYETTVALGFLTLGIVVVEPAPTDALFSVVIAVALVTRRFELGRVPVLARGLLGIFLILNIFSATAVIDVAGAARFFSVTLYLGVFALWLSGYMTSTRRARTLLRAYVLSAAVWAALASLALVVAFPGSDLFVLFDRARGLFKDPNVFGPFLVPAALVLISELVAPSVLALHRFAKQALLLVIGVGLVFSYSRSAWLNFMVGLAIMFVVFALRRDGGRKVTAFLMIVLTALIALAAVVAFTGSVDFLKQRAQFQAYDASRFEAQESGINLVSQYPFGIGPGQFEPFLPETAAAHSTYVRALAEQGLLGLVSILGLIVVTLLLAARNAILGRDTYGIGSAALLGAWCGLLVNSSFVDTLHWRHLWLVAALIWAGAATAESRTP